MGHLPSTAHIHRRTRRGGGMAARGARAAAVCDAALRPARLGINCRRSAETVALMRLVDGGRLDFETLRARIWTAAISAKSPGCWSGIPGWRSRCAALDAP
jgi:hypothetical protein